MSKESEKEKKTVALERLIRPMPADCRFISMDMRHLDLCEGNVAEALVLAKLLQWGQDWYRGRMAERRSVEDPRVVRSLPQLYGDLLTVLGITVIRASLLGLERRGLISTSVNKNPKNNLEQIPVRVLNVDRINQLLEDWEKPNSPVRKTRVVRPGFVLETKSADGSWAPIMMRKVKGDASESQGVPLQNLMTPLPTPIINLMGTPMGSDEAKESIRLKDKPQDKGSTLNSASGGCGGTQEENEDGLGFELKPPKDRDFFGNILDQASTEDIKEAVRILKAIKESQTFDFLMPSLTQRPSAAFLFILRSILELQKGQFNPPLSPGFQKLLGNFQYRGAHWDTLKGDIMEAINIAVIDAAAGSQRLPTLRDWVFRESVTQEGTSSLLWSLKKGLMAREVPKVQETPEKRFWACSLPQDHAEMVRLWGHHPDKRPNDEATFWRRLIEIQEHCRQNQTAILIHGALKGGYFRRARVPTASHVMQLLLRMHVELGLPDPGAWPPKVGDEVWRRLNDWGRNRDDGTAFDLDYETVLSQEEAQEQVIQQEVDRLIQRVSTDPHYAVADEVLLEAAREQNPNIRKLTTPMVIHCSRLIQLRRACYLGKSLYPPITALRALIQEAQTPAHLECHPFEEQAWADLGLEAVVRTVELWEVDEPTLLKEARSLGLLDSLNAL